MPMDFKKMNIMLTDLKVMRNDLLPDSKESQRDAELKEMDPFTRAKTQLHDILRPLTKEVERLQELRSNAPDGRDKATIQLYTENANKLKEAGDIWKSLKEIIQKDEAKKKVDEKTITDRKKMVTILGKEIQDLSGKNAHIKPAKETETLKTLRGRAEEKGRRRREDRNRGRAKKKKEEEEQDEADAAAGIKKKKKKADEGPAVDIQDDDMRAMAPASPEEDKFFAMVEEAKQEQDAMLDEILKGMTELKDIAVTMNTEIKVTTELANQIGEKMDDTIATFKSSNARLKEILDESGGLTRWCPMLICVILLIALVGYMFNMLKK
jgi:hypothetical protein